MKFKKLTILLFITLFFNTSLFANSKKFIFNDLKLYDSLLKKFDEEEIKANIGYEDQNNKYLFYLDIFENPVEGFTHAFYYFKKGDKKYKIQGFQIQKVYPRNEKFDNCLKDLKDVNNKYLELFKPDKTLTKEIVFDLSPEQLKMFQAKDGKGVIYQIGTLGRDQSQYDIFQANCLFSTEQYYEKRPVNALEVLFMPYVLRTWKDKQK
jgi:hypothetical protein